MVTIVRAGLVMIESDCVAVRAPPSVARTVKFAVCAVVGVPVITPAVDSDNPAGKDPAAISHVYGVVPPVATKVAE
jgi:hypothetical protein